MQTSDQARLRPLHHSHRTRSFGLSTDPFFVDKLRDVVGLDPHTLDKTLVLGADERSQVQALEPIEPMLPMGFGSIEGIPVDVGTGRKLPPSS